MAQRKIKLSGLIAVALVILVLVIIVIIVGLFLPKPQDVLQGQVEVTEYRISSKVPGRVKEIRVEEGQYVHKGDTVAILEAPEVQAKLSQAEAATAAAQAIETKARNGAQKEQIQGAYEMWQKAKAGLEVAEKSFNRVQRLYDEGVIAAQKRDEVEAQYKAMVATEKAAKSQYEMAVKGAREEDKAAAAAQVDRARGAISEVKSYIRETVLLAYEDGIISDIFPKLGELVGTGAPIMNVAMEGEVKTIFCIREDMLPNLHRGDVFSVYVPALDRTLKVRVTNMKPMGTYSVWKATKALDHYDLKNFEVTCVPVNKADTKDMVGGMTAVYLQED